MARVSFRYTGDSVEFYTDGALAFTLTVEEAVKLAKDIIVEFLLRYRKGRHHD